MVEQPSGTVTLVFTDIAGSTRLLDELGQEAYLDALAAHRQIVRAAFASHSGYEVDCEGDSFFYAFSSAVEAVAAVEQAMHLLQRTPIRIRVGVHTGEPGLDPPKYVGMDVHIAARVMGAGHGGQVLLSQSTHDLVRDRELLDLGEHRLKDLKRPERIFQLQDGRLPSEFPPLKSLNRTNLPPVATPLFGRDVELREIQRLVKAGVRLITLTGPGGTGKTRLGLHAAAELLDEFPDGVFFVTLAPLQDVTLVHGAVAQALGLSADDDIAERLRSRHLMLVLDNVEHLDGIAQVAANLLAVGENMVMIATGRSPLRLAAEHEFPVEPLSDADAVALLVAKAASFGVRVQADNTAQALCRRLDNLPLAVELAAARTKHLSAVMLLERLERALPLLIGGSRDVPSRQQTLRATIEWSHDLLSADERAAFRQIAVFHGGCTSEAAESVCTADFDTLASLVDKSLVMAADNRFLMLETIREYALERLEDNGERDEVSARHARFYLQSLKSIEPELRGPRTLEFLGWFDAEAENLWASLTTFLNRNEVEQAFTLADLLAPYWIARGRMSEGLRALERALEQDPGRSAARGRALGRVADLSNRLGHPEAGESSAREAVAIGNDFNDSRGLCRALECLVWIEYGRGNFAEAIALARSALDQARKTGDEELVCTANMELANALSGSGEHLDEARRLFQDVLEFRRRIGDQINIATALLNLSNVEAGDGQYRMAGRYAEEALKLARESSTEFILCRALGMVGYLALIRSDHGDAVARYIEALESAIEVEDGEEILVALEGIAFARADDDISTAIRIHGATQAIRAARGMHLSRLDSKMYAPLLDRLREVVGDRCFESKLEAGADLSEDEAIELARTLSAHGRQRR